MCPSNVHPFHIPAWPGLGKWNWARPAPRGWEQEDWLFELHTVFVDQRRLEPQAKPIAPDTAIRCCGLFIQSLWDTMKDSVTAYQDECFCNIDLMCAPALGATGPCVKMVEFGRKSLLCCASFHISCFKWWWELHLHFSQRKLAGFTLRWCSETSKSACVYVFWTTRELAWGKPLGCLIGQMFPETILESWFGIYWIRDLESGTKEIPDTPCKWLIILLMEQIYLVQSIWTMGTTFTSVKLSLLTNRLSMAEV